MHCPSISELPAPPPGKTGWPWTEESLLLRQPLPERHFYPRLTIVTPSFNQGRFLEETIRSVLLQGYPELEYFVIDGGSSDNSVEVIKKYSPWINYWVSEPDGGQSAAINRGLKMGSGVYATWINSDDMLCRNAFNNHLSVRGFSVEDAVYIGDCIHIDETGSARFTHRGRVQSLEDLVRIKAVWRDGGSIDQPAVLFPRELALRVGGLSEANQNTMDYELWGKLLLAGAVFDYTGVVFGIFRHHSSQKTADSIKQTESLLQTARNLIAQSRSFTTEVNEQLYADLTAYEKTYPADLWKHTGRLAKAGIPPSIVDPVRSVRAAVRKGIYRLIEITNPQSSTNPPHRRG